MQDRDEAETLDIVWFKVKKIRENFQVSELEVRVITRKFYREGGVQERKECLEGIFPAHPSR